MNQFIVLAVVIALMVVAMLTSRKEKVSKVETVKKSKNVEKDAWSNESFVNYGQVQQLRNELIKATEEKLGDDPEQVDQLKKIIDEWADLKVESFKDRRSWVRNPEKND